MPYVALDLETAPNPKAQEIAQEAAHQRLETKNQDSFKDETLQAEMATDPLYGRIVAAGLMPIGGDPEIFSGGEERDLLEDVSGRIKELQSRKGNQRVSFVTFNGLSFDVPFLDLRMRMQGLGASGIETRKFVFPPKINHLDLFELVTAFQGNRTKWLKKDLETVARLVGVDFDALPADPIESREVPVLIQEGTSDAWSKIETHLTRDLAMTAAVARRVWLGRGQEEFPF